MVLAAWLSLLLVSAATMARAQQPADAAALDAELATFRDGLFRAFNEGDYQRMLDEFCHKDVIATWQDGTTSQGHAGVIAEFDKLKQFIDQMKVNPTTDQRLVLNEGRLVVSSGDMQDDYALRRGHNVSLRSRWSATLVKENDRWWLISFSASTNAFDNEVINLYLMNMKYKTAALAGFIGLAVGIVTTIVLGKRRK